MVLKPAVIDAFSVLGLTPDVEQSVATTAYKKLALLHHPDRNFGDDTAKERFQKVGEAWAICQRHYDNPSWSQVPEFRSGRGPREQYSGRNFSEDEDIPLDAEEAARFFQFMFEEMFRGRYNSSRGRRYRQQRSGAFGGGIFTYSGNFADSQRRQEEHQEKQRRENEEYRRRVRQFEAEQAAEQAEIDRRAEEARKAEKRYIDAHARAFKLARKGDSAQMKALVEEFNLDVTKPEKLQPGKEATNKKAKATVVEETFETLLHAAAGACDPDAVTFLIERGAKPSALSPSQLMPFHVAIARGNIPVVRTFLDFRSKTKRTDFAEGCHPSKATKDKRTPLQLAIASGSAEMVSVFVKEATVHDVEKCFAGNVSDAIREVLLTKAGFNPNAPNDASTLSRKEQRKRKREEEDKAKAARLAEEEENRLRKQKRREEAEEAERKRKEVKEREEAARREKEQAEEAARAAEAARKAAEEAALREAEAARKQAEEVARRQAEAAKRQAQAQEAARLQAEAERRKAQERARREAEEEKRRKAALEARRKQEEEAAAARAKAEAERRAQEAALMAEAALKAQEAKAQAEREERERARVAAAAEAAKQAEIARLRKEEEERVRKEEAARLEQEQEALRLQEEKERQAQAKHEAVMRKRAEQSARDKERAKREREERLVLKANANPAPPPEKTAVNPAAKPAQTPKTATNFNVVYRFLPDQTPATPAQPTSVSTSTRPQLSTPQRTVPISPPLTPEGLQTCTIPDDLFDNDVADTSRPSDAAPEASSPSTVSIPNRGMVRGRGRGRGRGGSMHGRTDSTAGASETSESNHVGNGTRCRYFFRDGCARGDSCAFSHVWGGGRGMARGGAAAGARRPRSALEHDLAEKQLEIERMRAELAAVKAIVS